MECIKSCVRESDNIFPFCDKCKDSTKSRIRICENFYLATEALHSRENTIQFCDNHGLIPFVLVCRSCNDVWPLAMRIQ
ncbi:hypothetical protein HZS_6365 [Henneguya salminicola]|nr:hypothetical protein HZS_6365 [Henneguya salminicola]